MNFESAFEKYKNGTATEEEMAFVENEIAKARKLQEVMDEMDAKRVVEPAKSQDVKKMLNQVKKKSGIRTALISLAVVAIVFVLAITSLFIYANVTASGRAAYNREACIEAAKQSVIEHSGGTVEELFVPGAEKELIFEYGRLSSAIYVYEIEVRSGYMEYDIMVNSTNGRATIVDIGD